MVGSAALWPGTTATTSVGGDVAQGFPKPRADYPETPSPRSAARAARDSEGRGSKVFKWRSALRSAQDDMVGAFFGSLLVLQCASEGVLAVS
jgi:hypothetical protein